MRFLVILCLLHPCVVAQHVLWACATSTKEYVVGAKLSASGLFERTGAAAWRHAGYNHPWLLGVAGDPAVPGGLLIAGGNGLIRAAGNGDRWTILTGSDVTEIRDIAISGNTVYFSHSAGIRATADGGRTWRELGAGLHRQYTEAIRADPSNPRILLAGGEEGVFRSEDGGHAWRLAGAAGQQIMRIEGSPHDACYWLAATQGGGLFASRDCGRTFESNGNLGVGRTTYDIAFDPGQRNRVAAAVWGAGVAISQDGGVTWQLRNAGLPSNEVSSLTFDPGRPGRLYVAVHRRGVYVSENAGSTWTSDGMEDTHVNRLRFVPGVVR